MVFVNANVLAESSSTIGPLADKVFIYPSIDLAWAYFSGGMDDRFDYILFSPNYSDSLMLSTVYLEPDHLLLLKI